MFPVLSLHVACPRYLPQRDGDRTLSVFKYRLRNMTRGVLNAGTAGHMPTPLAFPIRYIRHIDPGLERMTTLLNTISGL